MYTSSVSALLSKNVGNSLTNYKTWGGIIYNVLDFKAKGDGITDDSGAIQSAINAASLAGGGTVLIPNNTFLIGSTLILKENVSLVGLSRDTSIIKAKNNLNTELIRIKEISYGEVRNLKVDGNKINQTAGNGIYCYSTKVLIQDVNVVDAKENGICAFNDTVGVISGCKTTYCGACGIRSIFGANILTVQYSESAYNDESGILLANASSSQIIYCKTYNNTTQGENSNGISVQSPKVKVIGNESYGNANAGIYSVEDYTTIIANDCHNNLLGCDLYHGGKNRTGFIVIGNLFHDNSDKGHSGYRVSRVTCKDNIIYNNARGLDFDSITDSTFEGNHTYDTSSPKKQDYSLYIHSSQFTSDRLTIKNNNLLESNTVGILQMDGVGNKIYVSDCIGYNPVGFINPTPSVPASGGFVRNTYGVNVRVNVFGGTVTNIQINGQSLNLTSGQFILAPDDTMNLFYSSAPGWIWFGL